MPSEQSDQQDSNAQIEAGAPDGVTFSNNAGVVTVTFDNCEPATLEAAGKALGARWHSYGAFDGFTKPERVVVDFGRVEGSTEAAVLTHLLREVDVAVRQTDITTKFEFINHAPPAEPQAPLIAPAGNPTITGLLNNDDTSPGSTSTSSNDEGGSFMGARMSDSDL